MTLKEYLNGDLTHTLWIILAEGTFFVFLSYIVYNLNPNNIHPMFYFTTAVFLFSFVFVSLRFIARYKQKHIDNYEKK